MAAAAGPRIVEVAEQILADIRRRKLRSGDPYLGTAETAQWLRVSGSTVNRALQLLAQRGVVQRRQRQGTIVLEPAPRRSEGLLRRVHLLVRRDHLKNEGLWSDAMLLGLQGALSGVELQFNFRPDVDEAEYVEQLVHEILASRQPAGLVLIRSTVLTQRIVAASGLPAVVSGMLQPSVEGLPSVDRDQRQIGVLLAGHLLASGCRRFLLVLRERMAAGDHRMLDGALATLAGAGTPLSAVTIRCLPTDESAVGAEVENWLREGAGREADKAPAGILCRSEALARGAAVAFESKRRGRRATIVVADAARSSGAGASFVSAEPGIAAEEWGATIGRALAAAARGEKPGEPVLIPVRLAIPAE